MNDTEQFVTWLVLAAIAVVIWKAIPLRVKGAIVLVGTLMLASAVFSLGVAQMNGLADTGVKAPPTRRNAVSPTEFHGGARPAANRALGKKMAARYGWDGSQWNALDRLVISESGWSNTAQNPKSTAYGIGQFLDKTWRGTGYRKTSDPRTQIAAMLKYIRARYGTPEQAWEFKKRMNWY